MSSLPQSSSWATKAEASAQQARRFTQAKETPSESSPSLPPLVRHPAEGDSSPLEQQRRLASAQRSASAARGQRATTAEAERQQLLGLAVPSVSTLNRDFHRLSMAYAWMREEASVPLLPIAATHYAGRSARRTSAPAAQRPALPQRSRRDPLVTEPSSPDAEAESGDKKDSSPVMLESEASLTPTGCATRSIPDPPPHTPDIRTPFHRPARLDGEVRSAGVPAEQPPSPSDAGDALGASSPEPAKAQRHSAASSRREGELLESTGDAAASPVEEESSAVSPPPRNPHAGAAVVAASSAASPARRRRGRDRDGRIMVVVRKRPLAADDEGPDCVTVDGPHLRIAVTKQRVDLSTYEESSDYAFDHAYAATDTNSDIFATSVRELLTVSLSGGSASCFAYGQTGSGKTYTMMGTDTESGLYLLAAADLFQRLGAGQQLSVCFYEIYCNSLFDLLNRRHPIVLREDANRRVNICGVVWRRVTTVEALWQLVRAGMEQRRTGTTSANEHSSRSHAILTIRISDPAHLDFAGSINFVDLAGSERAADTAAHDRLTRLEGAEINKSLLALKECIRSLDEKQKHVPFRGSRLTEVLRDSFTGNSKTVMIATVSPSAHNHEHTNNTLRYAFRVKGLTIASVEPSKARNAPRPYVPVARTRSNAGQNDRSGLTPTPMRGPKGNGRTTSVAAAAAGAEREAYGGLGGAAADASPSTQRARNHRRRRNPHRKNSQTGGGHAANTSSAASADSSVQYSGLSELLPRKGGHKARSEARGQRQQPTAEPSQLSGLSSPPSPQWSDKNASLPPSAASQLPGGSPSAAGVDMTAVERRLTRRIMAQLRRDLGTQLEGVLSEKDATIAALRCENAALRKALDRAQREGPHSDNSSTPPEADGRRSETAAPVCELPSPSILHEQLSSPRSLSSVSDDQLYHLI